MSLQESIERLRALDDQHPDWGNTLDVDPLMVDDIVAVVRDRIRLCLDTDDDNVLDHSNFRG